MSMKNNEHLIPVIILDMVNGLHDTNRRDTERDQLRLRLKATRDYCEEALKKHDRVVGEPTRGFALGFAKKKRS